MSSIQTLIPVIRPTRKSVLGGFNTGSFYEFGGAETSFTLPAGQVVPIQKWYPDNVRDNKREWFMAYIVDERNFREEEYTNYTDFVPVSEMNPVTTFLSPATMPNIQRRTKGTLLDMMDTPSIQKPLSFTPNAPSINVTRTVAYSNNNVATIAGGVPTGTVVVKSGVSPTGLNVTVVGQTLRINGTTSVAAATFNPVYTIGTNAGPVDVPVTIIVA